MKDAKKIEGSSFMELVVIIATIGIFLFVGLCVKEKYTHTVGNPNPKDRYEEVLRP